MKAKLFWLWVLIFTGSFSLMDARAATGTDVSVTVKPGTVVDDGYEENDIMEEAHVGLPSGTWLSDYQGLGIQADDDWYQLDVATGYERLQIKCTFLENNGDIDIFLYNASGTELERSANSLVDNESIEYRVPSSGAYYIKVCYGYGAVGNTYNLLWKGLPTFEDQYEENNYLTNACTRLPESTWLSTIDGLGMQRDEDWYQISVTNSNYQRVLVESKFTHSEGDIDIELFNSDGQQLTFPDGAMNDDEGIDFVVFTTGDYYIKVWYGNQGNAYDLRWNTLAATPPVVESLAITGDSSVDENKTSSYICKARYSNGSDVDVTASATWTENSLYASFDGGGVLCAGSVESDQVITITATFGGKSQTKSVTIKDVPDVPVSLTITGPDQVSENSSAAYTCTALFASSATNDVTALASWSENKSDTTISSTGVLTVGDLFYDQEVTITVSYEGKSATNLVAIKCREYMTYYDWSIAEEIIDQSAYADTPADDGIPNLIKYACGLSVWQEYCSSDVMTIAPESGGSTFSINYKRYKFASEVILEAVWAPTLTVLSNEWIPVGDTDVDVGEDADYVYRKASIPVGERGFIRLRATPIIGEY